MFIDISLATIITALISTYSYQVGKHGTKHVWQTMFKDDVPKRKPKYRPKHVKPVYDWAHDTEFKKSLERKHA